MRVAAESGSRASSDGSAAHYLALLMEECHRLFLGVVPGETLLTHPESESIRRTANGSDFLFKSANECTS